MADEMKTSNAPERPAALRRIPEADVVRVDVREELRQGREPFSLIMEARERVPEGGALAVRAIFEPAPLYGVMARHGFEHWTEKLAEDDWRVWFHPPVTDAEDGEAAVGETRPGDDPAGEGGEPTILDVRGLEPPEPLVRTLEALEELPDDATLLQINVRVPRFLLPHLEDRGYEWEIREQEEEGVVRVFIRKGGAEASGEEAGSERVLDVRVIPPPEKHPTIFQTFDALAVGESFVLVNDHDPKPLRYQLMHERTDEFRWEYLEEGPTVWRVRLSRTARP